MPVMIPVLFCLLFGLAFGSFLNVCITRLPRGESVLHPRSHCRQCDLAIDARDNIPILSWLVLRGKCRACGSKISWRYPFVETVTSLLFLMCYLKFGISWEAAGWAVFCFLLAGLAVMDAETMLLPDSFTVPGLILGVFFAASRMGFVNGTPNLKNAMAAAGWALLNALLAAAFLLLIQGAYWIVRRRWGMGLGDVKLIAMMAAWLGLARTALALFLAAVVGAAFGIALVATQGANRRVPAGQFRIPFGTFLSIGGVYSVFLGEGTVRWYLQFFR